MFISLKLYQIITDIQTLTTDHVRRHCQEFKRSQIYFIKLIEYSFSPLCYSDTHLFRIPHSDGVTFRRRHKQQRRNEIEPEPRGTPQRSLPGGVGVKRLFVYLENISFGLIGSSSICRLDYKLQIQQLIADCLHYNAAILTSKVNA